MMELLAKHPGSLIIQIASVLGMIVMTCGIQNVRDVTPSCDADERVCEFDWTVTAQETMVYYDRTKDKGFPVIRENNTFFRRLPDNCDDLEPLSDQDLATVMTMDGHYRVAYFINDQTPGPNIVVYHGQQVVVRVHNQLLQEGMSIHWHGMVQRGTPWMDGVSGVTQCPINPQESFTYRFLAHPAGTHWYHSHHGTQRTDGLFGALIVLPKPRNDTETDDREPNRTPKDGASPKLLSTQSDKKPVKPEGDNESVKPKSRKMLLAEDSQEVPKEYTAEYMMMVHDWFRDESKVIMTRYLAELQRFYEGYDDLSTCHYKTQQPDGSEVGTIAFESGLINGKGHFYPNKTLMPFRDVPLETYDVTSGGLYLFRVVNPSLNFAFKISIDQHQLHVVASDGNPINPLTADAVIVHAGERYDFYINATHASGRFWVRAQTTESYNGRPFDWDDPVRVERHGEVRAVLNYTWSADEYPSGSTTGSTPGSTPGSTTESTAGYTPGSTTGSTTESTVGYTPGSEYPDSEPRNCTLYDPCLVVNCPFPEYPDELHEICINMDDITSLHPNPLPPPDEENFSEKLLNFHFPAGKGGVLRSMVNGRQFVLPSSPPLISGDIGMTRPCDERQCDAGELCQCSYTLNVTKGNLVQMVLLSHVTPIPWEGVPASAHPVHLHGHHFHVLKVGYPVIDPVSKRYKAMNPDIFCPTDRCHNATWSDPSWRGGHVPGLNEVNPPLKDTVIVPAGGYVVIRFLADNPGWWIMHCHLELHQVEGMALLIQEGSQHEMAPPPRGFPTCGNFDWTAEEFEESQRPEESSSSTTVGDVTSDLTGVVGVTDGVVLSGAVVHIPGYKYARSWSFLFNSCIVLSQIFTYMFMMSVMCT